MDQELIARTTAIVATGSAIAALLRSAARAIPALTRATKDLDSQLREKAAAGLIGLETRPSTPRRAAPSIVEGRQ